LEQDFNKRKGLFELANRILKDTFMEGVAKKWGGCNEEVHDFCRSEWYRQKYVKSSMLQTIRSSCEID